MGDGHGDLDNAVDDGCGDGGAEPNREGREDPVGIVDCAPEQISLGLWNWSWLSVRPGWHRQSNGAADNLTVYHRMGAGGMACCKYSRPGPTPHDSFR